MRVFPSLLCPLFEGFSLCNWLSTESFLSPNLSMDINLNGFFMKNNVVEMNAKETCPGCHGEGKVLSLQARVSEEMTLRAQLREERRTHLVEKLFNVWDYAFIWLFGLLMPGGGSIVVTFVAKLTLAVWTFAFFDPSQSFKEGLLAVCGIGAGVIGAIAMCIWWGTSFDGLNPWSPKHARQERADRRMRERALRERK